jgi:hypothetical protein
MYSGIYYFGSVGVRGKYRHREREVMSEAFIIFLKVRLLG